jgi:ribose transport system ATP-binding protein
MSGVLFRATGLRKSYSVPVLTDFDFELRAGEVHALVGGNGAGKSTFARIVTGLTAPDAGRMEMRGHEYSPGSKREAELAGVVMVMQELAVIPCLSVAENVFLGRLPSQAGFVQKDELRNGACSALARVGLEKVDPNTPVENLGIGQQQLVELAKALSLNCRLLILDEPTAALGDPEIDLLFENMRRLQAEGAGIIYISHRMEEIRRIADRVTVLRDGRVVATHPAISTTPAELVREMVGHELPQSGRAERAGQRPVGLRIRAVSVPGKVRDVSFDAHAGESLGLAGLIGAGRTELLRAILGGRRSGGEIFAGDSNARENP